jgi:hypothetical protein
MDTERRAEMSGLFGRLINTTDPTRDVKLAAFGAANLASITWLTTDLFRHGLTSQWVEAYLVYMASASLGGAAWAAVEKIRGGDGVAPTGAKQGAEDKEGEQP